MYPPTSGSRVHEFMTQRCRIDHERGASPRTALWSLTCCSMCLLALWLWERLNFSGLDALRAAGLNGEAPRGGAAFKALITQLTNNAEWIILTAIGLFLTGAAGALIFGVRSAPEWLFKAAVGFLLLLVGVPAVLA